MCKTKESECPLAVHKLQYLRVNATSLIPAVTQINIVFGAKMVSRIIVKLVSRKLPTNLSLYRLVSAAEGSEK